MLCLRWQERELWHAVVSTSPEDGDRFCEALSGALQLCSRGGGFLVPRTVVTKLLQVHRSTRMPFFGVHMCGMDMCVRVRGCVF